MRNLSIVKKFILFFCSVMIVLFLSGCKNKQDKAVQIGIIVPLEHQAMREIVEGFTDALAANNTLPVKIKVVNAQGDANLMRAMIQQMRDENFDIIMPISTTALQMTLSLVKQQSVVGVAALYSEDQRKLRSTCNVTNVNDELSVEQQIAFIHSAYPKLKNLTLVYSSSDKIFQEAAAVKKSVGKYGITLNRVMVQNLQDLYMAGNAIPGNAGAIFVLKDGMVVNGIETLVKVARERKIPLITSDDGSVQNGAGFALGIHEKQIGVEAAKLVVQILHGTNVCALPLVTLAKPSVFINEVAMRNEGQDVQQIKDAAKTLHYSLEIIDSSKPNGGKQ